MIETTETMTTRDGVRLVATVWRPAGPGPFPVLLSRTPYGRGLTGPGYHLDVPRLVAAGYAVVSQDVRGSGDSGGESRFIAGEAEDGHDAVRWAATRPWSDGNVGMFGDSYLAITQLLAAQERPEGLRAIAPHVCPGGLYECVYQPGGIPNLNIMLTISAIVLGPLELDRRIARGTATPGDKQEYLAALARLDELYARLPLSDQPLLKDLVPMYAEWMDNPDPLAPLWRAGVVDHSRIEVPALVSTGWYDYFRDASIEHYERLRGDSRLVVGPWTHFSHDRDICGRDYGDQASQDAIDWTGVHLDWFGHWLRGEPLRDRARVKLFVMGDDEWREEADWPIARARRVPYHLAPGGTLTQTPATGGAWSFAADPGDPVPTVGGAIMSFDAYGPLDQRPLDGRADVLRYRTEPLKERVEVAGEVELVARVSSTAASADLAVKLIDVHPSGRAELLTDGITRVDGLAPGEVREVTVRLGAIANAFLPGHRIRIDVAGSNFSRFGRNLEKGTTTVHAPSYAVLPTIA
ncbi:CocE/NonD family hydrolase [Nonomuraea sp. FMUSA5-5]|uniref:CocE/NonD family hydrolase n=1 Tax=Nonomuraea composti TaxID=2720023 RepID=A0ABX1BDP2_9ACTN|nr:CocE/NonD family hydrolase [Nonomuraea sp. FMUSA5-5]NJP95756.1 CocE/NonD family hydrolase [Nonomuraea sp. FMUSA5-5]